VIDVKLFQAASEKFDIYHLSLDHGYRRTDSAWVQLLGPNCVILNDHNEVPNTIAQIVEQRMQGKTVQTSERKRESVTVPSEDSDAVSPLL
jgi:hypothetical protein